MRKTIAILTALFLLLQAVPVSAGAEAFTLPAVGDEAHGFEVTEIRDFTQIDAKVVRFIHRKTGAEVFWFANDDPNRAFAIGFRTDAIDDTGLPHVFEHSTLSGSEKYPSETLMFNLLHQTYNTYMNAQTGQNATVYPLASLSEEQLLKLADFYTDSCLHPMIMENEHIFRNEAWRYRLDTADAPLTLEGTVYSEMLGAYTLSRRAGIATRKAAFPGSFAANDPGGDPDVIPEMTWDALKDYHKLYYHPSNSFTCLYGKLEHWKDFLALLDGYFSAYERAEISHEDTGYRPITEQVTVSLGAPAEQGTATEHTSVIQYTIVCRGAKGDAEQAVIIDTMTDLFNSEASRLKQRLREALPYGSFSCAVNVSAPELAVVFSASNVNPEDAETFRTIVDEETARVAAEGFPAELVDSVQSSRKITLLTLRETSSPVENVISPFVSYAAGLGDPWAYINYMDSVGMMDNWNSAGRYAEAAEKYLAHSTASALVTVYPVPGGKEEKDAALAEKLAQTKAGMSPEEIGRIVEASNAPAEQTDNSAYLAELKVVDVATLPEEIRTFEVKDETTEAGVRHLDGTAGVNGIGTVRILLDAGGIPQEELRWVSLYGMAVGNLDTGKHTRAELAALKSRYLSGFNAGSAATEGKEDWRPWLSISWTALDEDLETGYGLAWEMLYDTKLDDPEKVAELIQRRRAALRMMMEASPLGFLLQRQKAAAGEPEGYMEFLVGTDAYTFLGEAEELLKTDPEAAMEKLRAAKEWFNNRTNATVLFAGNAESIALNRRLSDEYLGRLDAKEYARAEYRFTAPARTEALVIGSGVYFSVFSLDARAAGLEEFDGGTQAAAGLVTDMILIPVLRDGYGVYTPQSVVSGEKTLVVATYRDPNITQTYETMEKLPELIRGINPDQETLDGYILAAYSAYAKPQGELSGAIAAAADRLEGRDPERRLARMRELKKVTPESFRGYAELYAKLAADGLRSTAGGGTKIRENAEMFDVILDPFAEGTADAAP